MTARDNRGLVGSTASVAGWCDIGMACNGINFSKTPFAVRKAALDKGAETDEILKEYGYSETEIAKMKAGGVTRWHLKYIHHNALRLLRTTRTKLAKNHHPHQSNSAN